MKDRSFNLTWVRQLR